MGLVIKGILRGGILRRPVAIGSVPAPLLLGFMFLLGYHTIMPYMYTGVIIRIMHMHVLKLIENPLV